MLNGVILPIGEVASGRVFVQPAKQECFRTIKFSYFFCPHQILHEHYIPPSLIKGVKLPWGGSVTTTKNLLFFSAICLGTKDFSTNFLSVFA